MFSIMAMDEDADASKAIGSPRPLGAYKRPLQRRKGMKQGGAPGSRRLLKAQALWVDSDQWDPRLSGRI
jgi:hypothetical protein